MGFIPPCHFAGAYWQLYPISVFCLFDVSETHYAKDESVSSKLPALLRSEFPTKLSAIVLAGLRSLLFEPLKRVVTFLV